MIIKYENKRLLDVKKSIRDYNEMALLFDETWKFLLKLSAL